ncbi:hypothetical protein LQZ44_15480 [Alcaligenes nematophilus]|uniref:lipopolysaccharide biosynthesis protein n=1 Tax=Alcaligenes nematophilus TaxID=2994643 RepID=UPI0035B54A8F
MRATLNLLMRGLSLGCKFLLVFALAEFITPVEMGAYGLIAAIIGLGVYLLGLEFYTYSTRELVHARPEQRRSLILTQFLLYTLLYMAALPALQLVFAMYELPKHYLWLVYGLLIAEHIALELNRVLIALDQALYAGYVLFVRMGAWVMVLIAFQYWVEQMRQLSTVLYFWGAGLLLACILGLVRVWQVLDHSQPTRIRLAWLIRGLRVIGPLLVASIALRAFSTLDRFMLESVAGIEAVAPYVVYAGVCAAVISLIDAGVVDFLYPKLIRLAQQQNEFELRQTLKSAALTMVLLASGMLLIANLVGGYLVSVFTKPIYYENYWMLGWLSAGTLMYVLSLPAHLYLYATRKDHAIMYSQLLGLAVFLATFFILKAPLHLKEQAVLAGLIAGWMVSALSKSYWAFLTTGQPPSRIN